jgi:hypothetical protein
MILDFIVGASRTFRKPSRVCTTTAQSSGPVECAVPVARNSTATPAKNSLVLIGEFLLPFFIAHFAAEFTVKPAFIVPLPLNLSASKIQ